MKNSLIGYFKLNSNARDYSGYNRNGTATNVVYKKNLFGKDCAEFNSVDSVIDTGSDWLPNGDLSVSAWINPNGIQVAGRIIENGNLFVYYFTTQKQIGVTSNNGGNLAVSDLNVVELNQWTHIVATRQSTGTTKIYINGVDKTLTVNSGTPAVGTSNVIIGNRSIGDRAWGGLISELKVYNKILSFDEIQKEYRSTLPEFFGKNSLKNIVPDLNDSSLVGAWLNAGTVEAEDYSNHNNDGVANDLVFEKTGGKFNGVNAGIDTGSDWLPLGDLTFSAWVKPYSFGASGFNSILNNGSAEIGLYSGIQGLFYKSKGTSWSESYDSTEYYIWSLAVFDNKLYAGTAQNGKVFVFDGSSWSESYASSENRIYSLAVFDNKLYAGTGTGGKVLVFDGSTWSESYDSTEFNIYSLAVFEDKLYAGTSPSGKVFVFDGSSWSESYASSENRIYSLAVFEDKLYAGTYLNGKVFVFDGSTWSESYDSTETSIYSLAAFDNKLYAGTYNGGKVLVFDGSTWSESYDSAESYISSLAVFDNKLYAGTSIGGKVLVFDGSTWSESYDSTETQIRSLAVFDNKLYAGTYPKGKVLVFDGNELVSSDVNSINLNEWNHIAMSRNANGLTNFYVNGLLSGSADQNSGIPVAGLNNVFLGNDFNGLKGFDGLIQDLRVYSEVKSSDFIKNLFISSLPESDLVFSCFDGLKDLSKYERNLINTNTVVGKEMVFNGVDSKISVVSDAGLDLSSNLTISCWINLNSNPIHALVAKGEGTTSQYVLDVVGGKLRFFGYQDTIVKGISSQDGVSVNDNKWHHIVGTFDGTNWITYVDGIVNNTIPSIATLTSTVENLTIGKRGNNNASGVIKDVKVYNSVKSFDWVKKEYELTKKYY